MPTCSAAPPTGATTHGRVSPGSTISVSPFSSECRVVEGLLCALKAKLQIAAVLT
ncbi:MAG: hypothetical protein NTY37_11730 [Methanothrix sp.]|nr:hypothetical protein [Methanothrix sp.]